MTLYLNGLSFVAVPKTATISIERAFAPFARDFVPHRHEDVSIVAATSSNPCLCLVRHPLEWIKSYYKYLRWSPYFARLNARYGLRSKSFEQFVEAYMRGQRMWPEPKLSQHEYVEAGGKRVNYIYRYDDINRAVDHLSSVCGARVELSRYNKSRDIDLHLGREARLRLEKHMQKDYNIYYSAA